MTTLKKMVLLLAAVAVVAASCTTPAEEEATPDENDAAAITGSVMITGSSTIEPVTALNAEAFSALNPAVGLSVEGPGTGDGFRKFCADEADITGASREMREEEKAFCEEAGVEFIQLKFAVDGLTVITNVKNDEVTCLTFPDLYALLGPESIGFETWDAANALAAELEGTTGPFMNAPLFVTAPGQESGTYDSFVEIVIEDIAEERGQDVTARLDYVASANDNVIIEGVAGHETSLGWVGFSFYLANQDRVKSIKIDGGDGCVAPTPETITTGEYPIARPLYIYVNTARADANPAVVAYVDFFLSEAGLKNVDKAGYVRLDSYDELRATWANR